MVLPRTKPQAGVLPSNKPSLPTLVSQGSVHNDTRGGLPRGHSVRRTLDVSQCRIVIIEGLWYSDKVLTPVSGTLSHMQVKGPIECKVEPVCLNLTLTTQILGV
jgi:hypothetical protein